MHMELAMKNRCLDVLESKSEAAFLAQLVSFANHLGYEFAAALVVTDHSETFTEFQTITNAPQEFLDDFHNLEKGKLDPVSQHCKNRSSPIVWNVDTYSAAGVRDLWDYQAAHGYKTGIATAMHYRKGRHYMIGLSGSKAHNSRSTYNHRALDDFRSFAAYSQAAAFDLCLPPVTSSDEGSALTSREIDALRWTMDGKITKSVAELMSTTEEVASERLQSAMRKLACGTKYEAVLRAIRLGLVRCD
jgi:DNA-binding CsgD family transcriptional regulator